MKTVLSTKILTLPQKELLLNAGIGLVEYNALDISFIDFKLPSNINHIIVTSKNGAKAFLRAYNSMEQKIEKENFSFYCVGEKTKIFLEDFGCTVKESFPNSSKLADCIVENYKTNRFIFISGNLRREELPFGLSKNNIWYEEISGYITNFREKMFSGSFDALLFFSPSGIKSFSSANIIPNVPLFCIGETTAAEARKHHEEIIVANIPTVENVLVQVIKHFKKND